MHKGIVMELGGKHLIVMTTEGSFKKVPRMGRSCDVGEEIEFADPARRLKPSTFTFFSAAAVAVVLCVFVMFGFIGGNSKEVVAAYVNIDINPSIELGINVAGDVLEVRALNDDGELLLTNTAEIKGRNINDAVDLLMDAIEKTVYKDKTEGDIIITSTLVGKRKLKVNEDEMTVQMKRIFESSIQKNHPEQASNFHVATIFAPVEVREEAIQQGISTGKMAIYLKAKSEKVEVNLDDLKKESIHAATKNQGGVAAILPNDQKLGKKELQQLLKQLKDEEKQESKEEKAKNNANGKNNDPSKNDNDRKDDKSSKKDDRAKEDSKKNGQNNQNNQDDKQKSVKDKDKDKDKDKNKDKNKDNKKDDKGKNEDKSDNRHGGRDDKHGDNSSDESKRSSMTNKSGNVQNTVVISGKLGEPQSRNERNWWESENLGSLQDKLTKDRNKSKEEDRSGKGDRSQEQKKDKANEKDNKSHSGDKDSDKSDRKGGNGDNGKSSDKGGAKQGNNKSDDHNGKNSGKSNGKDSNNNEKRSDKINGI